MFNLLLLFQIIEHVEEVEMEDTSKNKTGENSLDDLEDEIFQPYLGSDYYSIDKNGVIWESYGAHNFSVFVTITRNENDKCYELNALQGNEHKEQKTIGKIYFSQLEEEEKSQINNLMQKTQKNSLDLRLICAADDHPDDHPDDNPYNNPYDCLHFRNQRIEYKHFLYLANRNLYDSALGSDFEKLLCPHIATNYTPILDRLYLKMFFPEIYKREEIIDKKNDNIELNFYSKRKKILWVESLAYIILLVLSVVAIIFSLINLMIFIIAAAVINVLFGIGLLHEFKFREIPYIDKLSQEEIDEIKKQIEQEKNKNKDQNQNKDDKKNENQNDQEKNKNVIEITTEVNPKNKESLTEKTDNMSKNRAGKNNEENKSTGVFLLINENKNDNEENKTNPIK